MTLSVSAYRNFIDQSKYKMGKVKNSFCIAEQFMVYSRGLLSGNVSCKNTKYMEEMKYVTCKHNSSRST